MREAASARVDGYVRSMKLLRGVTVLSVLGWIGLLAVPAPWVLDSTQTLGLPKPGYGMGMLLLVGAGATLLAMVALVLPKRAAVLVGVVPTLLSATLCAWMWTLVVCGSADPLVRQARVEMGRGLNSN
jgi:hypothetical protein